MQGLGMKFGAEVILPPTAQDYSAEVAQATAGADCVISIISETPFITWNTAWAQSGTTAQQYGPQGNLNEVSAKGAEEATNGDIIAGMYPDISTAPWAEYRTALDEAGLDTTKLDYNSLGGMGTWAAFVAFTQIAETINGDITAESFYDAAIEDVEARSERHGSGARLHQGVDRRARGLQPTVQPQRRVQQAREGQGRAADDRLRGRQRPRPPPADHDRSGAWLLQPWCLAPEAVPGSKRLPTEPGTLREPGTGFPGRRIRETRKLPRGFGPVLRPDRLLVGLADAV